MSDRLDFATTLKYPAIALISFWVLNRLLIWSRTTAMSSLRGPPADNFFSGSLPSIRNPGDEVAEWTTKYGKTFSVAGFLNMKRLYTVDPRAIGYVLSHSAEFWKPWQSRVGLMTIAGPGLVSVEGDDHKRQRKILNPVFSQAQIREHVPLYKQKAKKLRDIWRADVSKLDSKTTEVDVLSWLSRVTLDIVGEAGFGYEFNTLENEDNELAKAFYGLFATVTSFNIFEFLQVWIPAIGYVPTQRNRAFKQNTATLKRIGEDILRTKQAQLNTASDEKEALQGKDLLSVLIKSNITEKEGSALSQDEVLAQIATFISAGHETTSTALMWTLYALAKAPEVQQKLRQELLAFPGDDPSMEELNSFPYLDLVIREALRVHAPVELTSRQPWKDEIIPLSEPVIDIHGREVTELHVKKGDVIFLHIREINMDKNVWGPDAREFRPERWEAPPAAASAIPSVYSNLMTFLAGPRACIGWRMAVIEMKAFLFVLLRTFQFDIDPTLNIVKRLGFAVSRPVILGREKEGNQLPLKVSLYQSH